MIKELLEWEIKDTRLESIAKEVDEINEGFNLIDAGLAQTCEADDGVGLINPFRAGQLLEKIQKIKKEVNRVDIKQSKTDSRFIGLVKEKFYESLSVQEEYIRFFVTNVLNYGRKQGGVESFLSKIFPSWKLQGMKRKGVLSFLEYKAKNIDYEKQIKREDLMNPIEMNELILNSLEYEDLHLEQLPFLRKIIGDYAVNLGFETREQIDKQNLIAQKKKLEVAKNRISTLFGSGEAKLPKRILDGLTGRISELSSKVSPLDRVINELFYDIVLNWETYSSFCCKEKVMEVCAQRFHFYKDEKGKIKFYAGDIVRSAGHEYLHKVQSMIDKYISPGLKTKDSGYNLGGRIMVEGVPYFFENQFLDWLGSNRQKYEFSEEDIERAKLFNIEWGANRVIRLLHTIYERQYGPIEDQSRKAHLKLAEITGVQTYADDDMLPDESLSETYYFAMYFCGAEVVKRTMNKLYELETKRLGGSEKAREYLKKNENIITQGMLTGDWSWKTHGKFFLDHYWPKARQYCKEA